MLCKSWTQRALSKNRQLSSNISGLFFIVVKPNRLETLIPALNELVSTISSVNVSDPFYRGTCHTRICDDRIGIGAGRP